MDKRENRKTRWLLPILFQFLLMPVLATAQEKAIKVACIGNSVTFGYGFENPAQESYPAQLQQLLGGKYEVKNFGRSGATLLKKGHRQLWYKAGAKNGDMNFPFILCSYPVLTGHPGLISETASGN